MAILMINVPDEDQAEHLRREFEKREGIKGVSVIQQSRVSDTALASEASLAEAWLSPEDDHWDDYFKKLCTKGEI